MMAVISFFLMICIFPSFSVKSQFICVSVYLSSNGTGSDSHKQSHPAFSFVHLFSHFSLSQSWQHNFVPHSVISYSEQNISSSSNPLFPYHLPPAAYTTTGGGMMIAWFCYLVLNLKVRQTGLAILLVYV